MNTNEQLKKLIKAEMNDEYLANYMCISIERVRNAKLGIYEDEPVEPPRQRKRSAAQPTGRQRQVPATRPFPILSPDMPDTTRIILLTRHGLSVKKMRKYLSFNVSDHQINRYVTKKLGPARKGNSSAENWISPTFKPYVVECLSRLGKDPYKCEICLDPVPKGCVIHHTKYAGATIYDLMYVCQSCNLSRENKGLT